MEQVAEDSLVVTAKSIEAVYREYRNGAYVVNRRYQRKLVWSVDERKPSLTP